MTELVNINTNNTAISASTSTTNGQSAVAAGKGRVIVLNGTNAVAFVKSGSDTNVVATTADYPIGPGVKESLAKEAAHTYFAAILSAGTGSVYFIPTDAE